MLRYELSNQLISEQRNKILSEFQKIPYSSIDKSDFLYLQVKYCDFEICTLVKNLFAKVLYCSLPVYKCPFINVKLDNSELELGNRHLSDMFNDNYVINYWENADDKFWTDWKIKLKELKKYVKNIILKHLLSLKIKWVYRDIIMLLKLKEV